jgi:prepilin signal peptidase PulO-like enzyme (type II secretory pathway)
MFDNLKAELKRQPHELEPEKLKQAQGLAKVLTILRKAVSFLFYGLMTVVVIEFFKPYMPDYLILILTILGIIFVLFKFRDYIRGTI